MNKAVSAEFKTPHTRLFVIRFISCKKGRGLRIGGRSNHYQLKRKSLLSLMIPHTRIYLKWFTFYERGRGLSIGGGPNHDQ